ncbi:translation initiation factor-like protein eif-2b subunit alpha [Mollisia scopiformis]|uniref:Translation initiation factor eIF2B subunit alpha n=1 Tax=Mollisia scopiformis TaxID=149040 RepID=A0A194X7V0_MOLSC|nr:translation initiation factor-like protein eif-2b subunit alpha [Mollisia scopiformis]KUJ16179.1 translation initiation factor-like protein eif-2b subunit alpha [Mollisia scopiformis]
MDSVGNVPPKTLTGTFDIVETYHRILEDDPEITMPVAAIEALVELLAQTDAVTVYETLDLIQTQSAFLKMNIPNSIPLQAGTELFQQYILSCLKPSKTSSGNFEAVRQHLVSNGRLFVHRAKNARDMIARHGQNYIRDGNIVLTHGGSRVVGALLRKAADVKRAGGNVRFKVIYVVKDQRSIECRTVIDSLRAKGIPVAEIDEGTVAYAMRKVDMVIVGAEGVVENGGIISRLGTFQIAQLAMAAKKPFYVAVETHKFVREFILSQDDMESDIDQKIIRFEPDYVEDPTPKTPIRNAVDFTPPKYIAALITENGPNVVAAVSEQLIFLYSV